MSQCSTRKCGSTINRSLKLFSEFSFDRSPALLVLFVISLLTTGSLTGCSVAGLKEAALDGYDDQGPTHQPLRFRRKEDPEVLKHAYTIHGGAPVTEGVLGEFTRIVVGGGGLPIRFEKPVSVGGYGDFLFVLDGAGPSVYKYNLKDKTIETFGQVGQQFKGEPTNIFVESDLSFYIADPAGKRVLYYDKDGFFVRAYMDLVNLSRPIDVFVDKLTGDVYIADGSFSHVVVFNKLGTPLRAIGSRGNGPGKFRAITAITKGARDSIYIADRIELPVQELGVSLGALGQFRFSLGEGEITWPTAIAIDAEQRVYVSDKSDNTIKVYDDIRLIAILGGGGSAPGRFRLITDMWMSKEQKLYVADSLNRRVQVFDVVPSEARNDLFILQ